MSDALQQALQRREQLVQEMALLDKYVELHVRLFGDVVSSATSKSSSSEIATGPAEGKSEKANDPKAVANGIEAILSNADKPVQRGKLIALLADNGIPIRSQDKSKYIGTILWRNRSRFVNIEGRGYWMKDRPVPSLFPDTPSMFEPDS